MPAGTRTGGGMPGPTPEPLQTAADGLAGACAAATGAQTGGPATSAVATSRPFTLKRTASRSRWLRIPRDAADGQRPSLDSPRRVMHVLIARAMSRPSESVTSHSASPIVRPVLTTRPVAMKVPVRNGRRKLILSSRVVKLSPSARVDAYATPIAASAASQRTPPWSVPIGFACCGPASSSKTALPGSTDIGRKPMSFPTGATASSPRMPAVIRSMSRATDQLEPDGVPDRLELEERGDVVRALRICAAANDSFHVLRAELLQLRGVAIGARQIERGDIHMRCEHRRELATQAGEDVHHPRRNVGGREAFRELDRNERVRFRCDQDRGVPSDDHGREPGDETEERRLRRKDPGHAGRLGHGEVEVGPGDGVRGADDLRELV